MGTPHDTDHVIAALAAGQYGVVTRQQLLSAGLTSKEIAVRVRAKRLLPSYPGVYAVGHASLMPEGRRMAAVLACGSGAVLSHGDAAALWGIAAPRGRLIHVSRPSTAGRGPDPRRIRLHRVGTLQPWERTLVEGLPTTTVARTLLDLSSGLRSRAIEDAIAQASRLQLFDLVAVGRCLAAHPRQHGAPALRRVLEELRGTDAADLHSALEVLLLQVCDDYGLPRPATNARVEGLLVDFCWPAKRLVVEADSYTYHSMPSAFERDRERDQQLTLAGYTVVRFTYKQVTRRRRRVAADIRRLLA
jgi:very-short-patch-repair endonuclease